MRNDVPSFIMLTAPYMEELIRLRAENHKIRLQKFVQPGWIELLKDSGYELRQDDDGKWGYSIRMYDDINTGGGGYDTAEIAFQKALERTREMKFVDEDDED